MFLFDEQENEKNRSLIYMQEPSQRPLIVFIILHKPYNSLHKQYSISISSANSIKLLGDIISGSFLKTPTNNLFIPNNKYTILEKKQTIFSMNETLNQN